MKIFPPITLFLLVPVVLLGQYDRNLVEIQSATVSENEVLSVIRMSMKDAKIKVKYFAGKDALNNRSVVKRYEEWKRNKNIIAVSSGTYMTTSDPQTALPVGICVDAGITTNLRLQEYDGLVIVYATGGAVVYNINDGIIPIGPLNSTNGKKENVNIKSPQGFRSFTQWAEVEKATVFQTHLFIHKDRILINSNGSPVKAARRFFASCKGINNTDYYYILNLPFSVSLFRGVQKAKEYLSRTEKMSEINYIINLDPGRQDVFYAYDMLGNQIKNERFTGTVNIDRAVNLLVFYYE